MYTIRRSISHACLAFFLLILDAQGGAIASETLLEFDFDDALGGFENSPELLHGALSTTPWQSEKGSLTSFSGNPGLALAARNFADGNTLWLEVEIDAGLRLSVDTVQFDHFASGSGPKTWAISIDGQTFATGDTPAGFATVAANVDLPELENSLLIAITGNMADSNNGTYRVDNFSLGGTISSVPIPASMFLLTPAVLALSRRRRS